jgi:hypothetical protein
MELILNYERWWWALSDSRIIQIEQSFCLGLPSHLGKLVNGAKDEGWPLCVDIFIC